MIEFASTKFHASNVWREAMRVLWAHGGDYRGVPRNGADEPTVVRSVTAHRMAVSAEYPVVDSEVRDIARSRFRAYARERYVRAVTRDGGEGDAVMLPARRYAPPSVYPPRIDVERVVRALRTRYLALVTYGSAPRAAGWGVYERGFPLVHAYTSPGPEGRCALSLTATLPVCDAWSILPFEIFTLAVMAQHLALVGGYTPGVVYLTVSRLYASAIHLQLGHLAERTESGMDGCTRFGPFDSVRELCLELQEDADP